MGRYRYNAVDSEGKPASGELEAAGAGEAREALAAGGLDPGSIRLSEVSAAAWVGGWVSTEDAVELARGLADLANAGVPLAGGLRALADELPGGRRPFFLWYLARVVGLFLPARLDPRTRREARLPGVLRAMSGQLEAGLPLESVIEAQGRRFPAQLRGLVLAGLRSGHLAEVLEEFVDIQRAQVELRRRIWLSLAYPIVLVAALAALALLFHFAVVPEFVVLFDQFEGVDLPRMTVFFLQVMGPITWFLVGGLVLLVVIGVVLPAALPAAAWVPWLLYQVPLIGPLCRFGRLAQFSRLMRVLLEQEVPLPEALRLSGAGLGDAYLARGCRQAAEEVEAGRPLAECLAARWQFPPSMIPLIGWGQRAPAMADAFRASAEMFEGRVQGQGILLETVLVPAALLLVAMFVGLFILAVFLPMISVLQELSL